MGSPRRANENACTHGSGQPRFNCLRSGAAQTPWALAAPLPGDERWILARIADGVPLNVRLGKSASRTVSARPAWRPLFERYFEQQGLSILRKRGAEEILVLEAGQLSVKQRVRRPLMCVDMGVPVGGRLPPESVQRIIRLNFGRFRGCAVQNNRPPIDPQGRVTVRFTIGLDGQVTGVLDVGSTVLDREFIR